MPELINFPRLFFTLEAWEQLQCYLLISDIEVSGFGRVEDLGNDYLVTEIYLPDQEGNSVESNIDEVSIALLFEELDQRGIDLSELRLWWHSHVKLQVYWSSIDTHTIEKYNRNLLFSIVGNQSGDILTRMDLVDPNISIDNIGITLYTGRSSRMEEFREEIAQKVRVKASTGIAPKKLYTRKRVVAVPHDVKPDSAWDGEDTNLDHPVVVLQGGEDLWFDNSDGSMLWGEDYGG